MSNYSHVIPPFEIFSIKEPVSDNTVVIEFRDPQPELQISFNLHVPANLPETDVFVPIIWTKDVDDESIFKFHYQHERGTRINHRGYFELGHGADWVKIPDYREGHIWQLPSVRVLDFNYVVGVGGASAELKYASREIAMNFLEILNTTAIQNPSPIKRIHISMQKYAWGYAPMFIEDRGWLIENFRVEDSIEKIPEPPVEPPDIGRTIILTASEWNDLDEDGQVEIILDFKRPNKI